MKIKITSNLQDQVTYEAIKGVKWNRAKRGIYFRGTGEQGHIVRGTGEQIQYWGQGT